MAKLDKGLKKAISKAVTKATAEAINAVHYNKAPVRAKTPRECHLARARMRGFNDAIASKPFRESYDMWRRRMQWAYERGRMEGVAAVVAARRLNRSDRVRRWRPDEFITGPLYAAVGITEAERIRDEMRKTLRTRKGG